MIQNQWQLLCITSSLLLTSLFYFVLFSSHCIIECILAFLLLCIILTSQLFWYNPIRYSIVHRIDAVLAKITIFSFMAYTLITKLPNTNVYFFSYILLLCLLFCMAISSEYYSQKEWLSVQHIVSHGLLHICSFIGTFYAFSP
jgi:hypothetical protein